MGLKNFRTLSKTLSQLENGGLENLDLLKKLYEEKRGVPILGITGPPGAGKSTLVDQLIRLFRSHKKTVAVLAIDPSSPFSGGAVLGDRIRMQRHTSDDGVFIRSIGSRGAHGGLSRAAHHLALCFDAHGFDQIIIETVGVGQTELDIMGLASTVVVIFVPESGDVVQTLKAGLTEIGDIFVVNKSDRPGASQMQTLLKAMEESVSVLLTRADQGEGLEELWKAIGEHEEKLKQDPAHKAHQTSIRREQFLEWCGEACKLKIQEALKTDPKWKSITEKVASQKMNPFEGLEEIIKTEATFFKKHR